MTSARVSHLFPGALQALQPKNSVQTLQAEIKPLSQSTNTVPHRVLYVQVVYSLSLPI